MLLSYFIRWLYDFLVCWMIEFFFIVYLEKNLDEGLIVYLYVEDRNFKRMIMVMLYIYFLLILYLGYLLIFFLIYN